MLRAIYAFNSKITRKKQELANLLTKGMFVLPGMEHGPRLPKHFTTHLLAGLNLWNANTRRLGVEFDVTNVGNSAYKIAKESEEIPIPDEPGYTIGATLRTHF